MTELADTFSVPRSQFYSSFLMTDSGRVSQRLDSNTKYIYKILHLFFVVMLYLAFYFDILSFCCALFESTCKDIISRPEYIATGDAS